MTTITTPPPNRTVALLTPLVFAPLAGAISVAAAEFAPGTNIDETSLTAIFIAGATIAFGKAAQWTKGWQAQEQRDAVVAPPAPAGFELEADDDLVGDDFDEPIAEDDGIDVSDEEILADIAAFHLDDDTASDLALDPDEDEDEDDEADDDDRELMALLSARED